VTQVTKREKLNNLFKWGELEKQFQGQLDAYFEELKKRLAGEEEFLAELEMRVTQSKGELLQAMLEIYDDVLTEEDIDELIVIQHNPVVTRMRALAPDITRKIMKKSFDIMERLEEEYQGLNEKEPS
jgi:hypothetical protein